MKLNQKGLYPHNYIHAGANGNPFVFNYEVITNDYAVLTLTDLQGKTNEIIDISSSSFEITEYYLEDNPQIKFWVVCGDRLPKYRNDFGSVDVPLKMDGSDLPLHLQYYGCGKKMKLIPYTI